MKGQKVNFSLLKCRRGALRAAPAKQEEVKAGGGAQGADGALEPEDELKKLIVTSSMWKTPAVAISTQIHHSSRCVDWLKREF